MSGRASRIAREPLAQFALVAAIAFGMHAARPHVTTVVARAPTPDRRIAITADFVDALRRDLAARSGHAPSSAELRDEVERFVDEEVLFREAIALGLDRGDVVVRRRLVQKMEFVVSDNARLDVASDAVLQAWLEAHPERYREPATLSFTQVFIGRDRHGDDTARVAADALASLRAGADPGALGDPFPLGATFAARGADGLDGRFGDGFWRSLDALPLDRWSGPVSSRYGLHLVRVSERSTARLPTLDAVRERLRSDRADALRAQANRDAIAQMRAGYRIRIEGLPR